MIKLSFLNRFYQEITNIPLIYTPYGKLSNNQVKKSVTNNERLCFEGGGNRARTYGDDNR